jgi:hypothetical protein
MWKRVLSDPHSGETCPYELTNTEATVSLFKSSVAKIDIDLSLALVVYFKASLDFNPP